MNSRLFLALPFFLAACTLGSNTQGQAGHLTFDASSSMCTLGCALDSPILEGSSITIQAQGGDPKTPYTLRLNPASLGTVDANQTCSNCAVIETTKSGAGRLEAYDGRGNIYDAVDLTIAKADHVESTLLVNGHAATASANGSYDVHVGDALQVHSVVSVGGKSMVFTRHGLLPSYSDEAIVGSDTTVLIGATDIEYAIAKSPGTATTTMTAHGAQSVVVFNVVK